MRSKAVKAGHRPFRQNESRTALSFHHIDSRMDSIKCSGENLLGLLAVLGSLKELNYVGGFRSDG